MNIMQNRRREQRQSESRGRSTILHACRSLVLSTSESDANKSDTRVERTREENLFNFHDNQSLPEAIHEVDYCVLRNTRARGGAGKKREEKIIELVRLIRFGVTDFVGQHIVTE